MVIYITCCIVSYLIGSISFGTIIARLYNKNIFEIGSGNPGATNVKRTIGASAGNLVFVLDFLKGFIPCWLIMHFFSSDHHFNIKLSIYSLIGILIGHSLSIFNHFRGGKGVSSSMGGILAIMPRTFVIGTMAWLVIFHATRIVSFASLCFAFTVLLTTYLFGYPIECIILAVVLNIIIFWRHKDNIVRLAKGTEYKFIKKG